MWLPFPSLFDFGTPPDGVDLPPWILRLVARCRSDPTDDSAPRAERCCCECAANVSCLVRDHARELDDHLRGSRCNIVTNGYHAANVVAAHHAVYVAEEVRI